MLNDNIRPCASTAQRSLSTNDIRALFTDLPPTQKKMLQLRAAGYKYSEIAEKENMPIGTVKWNIQEAKRKIKKNNKLEDFGE